MKRLAAVLLLAGLSHAPIRANDPVLLPTTPQIPSPHTDANRRVAPDSGGGRFLIRIRADSYEGSAMPLPTGYSYPALGGCPSGNCEHAEQRSCWQKFKAWACFQPTTRDALPKLRPHPYVGPITGTFTCGSVGAPGCAVGAPTPTGCATGCAAEGMGRFGFLPARSCKGQCVPPADDAIPGYRFANSRTLPTGNFAPSQFGSDVPSGEYPAYKPAGQPSGAGVRPAAGTDPVKRPFTRP